MDATTRYVPLEAACKTLEQRLGRLVSVEDVLRHAADNTIMLYWDTSSLKLKGVRHTVPEDLDAIDVNDDDDAVVEVPRDIYEIHFDGFGTPDYFLALADGDISQWPSRSPVIVAPTAPGFHWELRERNPAIPLSKHSGDDYLPGSRVPRIAELRVDLEMLEEFDALEAVDGVGPQDLADMVEIQNNERCIDWEFWAAKMPVWTTAQAVRLMAALEPELFTDLSTQRNDSAGAAKERARRLEQLTVAHRMMEATPAQWLKWADDLGEPVHLGFRIALERTPNAAGTFAIADKEADNAARNSPGLASGDAKENSRVAEDGRAWSKPLPRHHHQEREVLRVLRELEHDPVKLPRRTTGVPWVKSEVRERLHIFTDKVFEKAWERLRARGEIKEN